MGWGGGGVRKVRADAGMSVSVTVSLWNWGGGGGVRKVRADDGMSVTVYLVWGGEGGWSER